MVLNHTYQQEEMPLFLLQINSVTPWQRTSSAARHIIPWFRNNEIT